jgi:glycosyltransferase involved in cell wall biosynthesis
MSRQRPILFVAEVRDDMQGGVNRHFRFVGERLRDLGYPVDFVFLDQMPDAWSRRVEGFSLDLCRRAFRGVQQYLRRAGEPALMYWSLNTAFPFSLLRKQVASGNAPLIGMTFGVEARWWNQLRHDAEQPGGPRIPKYQFFTTGWVRMKVLSLASHSCDHIVCVSDEDREYLVARLGLQPARVTAIPVGVDPAFLAAEPSGRGGKNVLFLGTWIWRKGVKFLMDAMIEVWRSEPDCRLSIIGTFQPAETILAQWPAELRGKIRAVPSLRGDDLVREYESHDIFVLPSLFEGMPLSLAEAMAVGLAVVTTATCGMRELVKHRENGLLVPPRDASALASAILELVRDPALRHRLGNEGRATIREWTWARIGDEFLRLFKRYAPSLT